MRRLRADGLHVVRVNDHAAAHVPGTTAPKVSPGLAVGCANFAQWRA